MTPETPEQRARREQQRARREHVEQCGVHNAAEAVKRGYGACKKCKCTKFVAGGGDDVSCGAKDCQHGYYDHKQSGDKAP